NDGFVYAVNSNAKLYRSLLSILNWTNMSAGLPNTQVESIISCGGNLIIGTYSGFYYSTNDGSSWDSTTNDISDNWGTVFTTYNGVIYAGTYAYGIYFSKDNGMHWTTMNNGLPNGMEITSIVATGNNLFAGSFGNGVYLSTNA